MAIYQYYLALVPKTGLLIKHKEIPKEIEVSIETGYFEAKTEEYWKLAQINYINIKIEIDKIISKANWGDESDSFNWKTNSDDVDNDAWMSINSVDKKIVELSFRADLRDPDLRFLNEMLVLARKYDMIIMDSKGNLINPVFDELKDYIKMSSNYKFLVNPEKFFDDLNNEN